MTTQDVSPDVSRSDLPRRQVDGIDALASLASFAPGSATFTSYGTSTEGPRLPPASREPRDPPRSQSRVRPGLSRLRVVRFGIVAAACTLMQLTVLGFLTHLAVDRVVANGIGYLLAAQSNFVLSAGFTWRDRRPRLAKHSRSVRAAKTRVWSARWAKFNATAVAGLAVNELAFIEARHAGLGVYAAASVGILSAAMLTFTASHLITFREAASDDDAEQRPHLEQIRSKAQEEGVAFFLPAFNEAGNLLKIVPEIIEYFDDLACSFTLIIVDDGSTRDETYEVAERLADAYPGHVRAIHHATNKGYGAALQTGLKSSLGTDHGLIAFCDADDQFDIRSFGTLLAALQSQAADASIGYRIERADPLRRRLMGRAWHLLSRLVLGVGMGRDVDCGFKVFTRRALEDVVPYLQGRYATVSPEILYRIRTAGYKISEAGVTHETRTHGQQTGASPKVVLVSFLSLLRLRTDLRAEVNAIEHDRAITPWAGGRSYLTWVVGIMATVLSVTAYTVTARLHAALLYVDTISHMEIARRVVDGTSPGLAQLGGVWLPLQHILMTAFIWDGSLYQNGLAGSIVSMAAYVVTTVLIYKIVARLTGQPIAGIVAATVFALNPDVLYMQSTPMTEPLLYCMTAGMIYCIQQWANTDRYQYLMGGAVFSFLGTLTRYETWPITACLVLAVAFIAWYRRSAGLDPKIRRAGVRDRVIAFSVVAFAGIGGWALWNWVLFGNPLNFQDGQYAKPSLWITADDVGLGSWSVATKTFMFAMKADETWPLLALALAGLIVFLAVEWRNKGTLGRSLPVLSVLIMIPFFIASIYTGQRPLYVVPLYTKLYNVRFALIMLLPTAILIGYLIASLRRWRPVMFIASGLVVVMTASIAVGLLHYQNVATYNEVAIYSESGKPVPVRMQIQRDVAAFVKSHYNGGRVLMQDFSNEFVAFQVPSGELVYEGSYGMWSPALRDPSANHIRWIVEWCGDQPDQVCRSEKQAQLGSYKLVYHSEGAGYRVYELRS